MKSGGVVMKNLCKERKSYRFTFELPAEVKAHNTPLAVTKGNA
jgi:hypothetical protein